MPQSVAAQAARLAGYDDVSRLRQAQDVDWVLDAAPDDPRQVADLGCGTGSLLAAALARFPTVRTAVGTDRETGRLAEAQAKLTGLAPDVDVRLEPADLRDPGPLTGGFDGPFDLVTSTSVLHWLYPHEQRLLAWVAARLAPTGAFVLTTHHPARDEVGFGGSDDLAREALGLLGFARDAVPGMLAGATVVPVAVRCRSVDDLAELLGEHFVVEDSDERQAVVRAGSGEEYQRFHAATFGTYYSRVLGPETQDAYFAAIGQVAQRRLARDGHVTQMPVRRWRCRPLPR
jgi:SAM-dependent methyltransferase